MIRLPLKNKLQETKDYQKLILHELENNGYLIRDAKTDYNAAFAMDTGLLFKFLNDTQPDEMTKLTKYYKENTEQTIINYLNNEICNSSRSLLDVLKTGIEFNNGATLQLMYRKPATSFNKKATELYDKNILSVMEEVNHKDGERIDLVIFLNGLAIFAFELKCNTSGQDYNNAIWQFCNDRDYKTRLFMFKAGVLASFAMDLHEVYMCTRLHKKESVFLPFNKGNGSDIDCGKGNPLNQDGIGVSYMWEDILTKDMVLYLIDSFIFVQRETKIDADTGKKTKTEKLIFPRYHQLNAIRKLVADFKEHGSECNYLIQHSAGSGKTNTISWLAHRLTSLHDDQDKIIFDTVIIATDRIVVDRQLQDAVTQIDHKLGLIKVMDDKCNSADLASAINGNTKIICTTIQKFRFIIENNLLGKNQNKHYAVIVDEAHASTAGSNMTAMMKALSEEDEEQAVESWEDKIDAELSSIGKQPNVSVIGFTATPKGSTLNLFGTINEHGRYAAFDTYSMKQAIEEGFILNVLDNYTTYKTYCQINKKIEDDPDLKTSAAKRKIKLFVNLHDTNISQKIAIIMDHFTTVVRPMLGGKAKAMVVTSSRAAAVKYRNAFEEYIRTHDECRGIRALVAFSGKVKLGAVEYTEAAMNSLAEEKLRTEFDKDCYQVLLVANKYQTGFDQPKLCAMYVDKKLRNVAAVQTLSRLNRICRPYDKKTFILDFQNSYEDIKKAFAPYYTVTELKESISPSDVRTIERKIDEFNILDQDAIDGFNKYLYQDKLTDYEKKKMWFWLDMSLNLVKSYPDDKRLDIKVTINNFIRLYTFLIQATMFRNAELHKKYNFLSYLVREINVGGGATFTIADKIEASDFKQKVTGVVAKPVIQPKPTIELTRGTGGVSPSLFQKLSTIISEINAAYGTTFDGDVASKTVMQIRDILLKDEKLKASANTNTLKDFKFTYDDAVKAALKKGYSQNTDFFKLLMNNADIKKKVMGVFTNEVYTTLKKADKFEEDPERSSKVAEHKEDKKDK